MTRDFLTTRDVAELWTKARDAAPPNRYQDNPMPMPSQFDPQRLVWVPAPGQTMADLKRALRSWFLHRTRPVAAAGAGELPHLTLADVARIWTEG